MPMGTPKGCPQCVEEPNFLPLASTPSIRLPASRRRTRTPTRGFASPRRWFRFIPMPWDALSATSCCEAGPNLSGHTNHGRPKWMRIPLPRPTSTPSASSKLVIVRRCPHSPHWSAAQLRTTGRISSQTAAERRTGSIIDLDWGARPRGRAAHFRYWHTASVRPATQDALTAPKPTRAIVSPDHTRQVQRRAKLGRPYHSAPIRSN